MVYVFGFVLFVILVFLFLGVMAVCELFRRMHEVREVLDDYGMVYVKAANCARCGSHNHGTREHAE